MGILDVFIDIPRNIGNIMCCSARIDRDETTVGIVHRLWNVWHRAVDVRCRVWDILLRVCFCAAMRR